MRRVARVRRRPFGTISLFLAATGILGLTSLCYVWESGQATTAALNIQVLQGQLLNAENQTAALRSRVANLTSDGVVMQAARTKYGMIMPSDTSSMQQITVPGPVITHRVVVPASPHVATATTHVAATDAAVTSWWQQAWVALYKLLQ
jgi:cell division protein FtsB